MSARLLVVQHEDDAPVAWFGEWMEAAGIELIVVAGHRGDLVPESLQGYDGLLVLGGAMGAYDDARYPWLTPTKRLIADTIRQAQKAFLGICLGHQLASVAAGGGVGKNPAGTTIGLQPVRLTDAGHVDHWLATLSPLARAMHWNDDIVTRLPAGAVVLARSPDGHPQAVRLGARGYGVQFHPEVSPAVFDSWGRSSGLAQPPSPMAPRIATALAEIGAATDELRATWEPLARTFAEAVLEPATVRNRA